jgi:peroxiredoxin
MKSSTIILVVILIGFLCFVMAACLLGAGLILIGNDAGSLGFRGSPMVGQIAPNFQLQTIDGHITTLNEFRGTPVMVNFWAAWCDPCIDEMPIIQSRYQRHYPELVVLAIEEDGESPKVQELIHESGFGFMILGGNESVARQYNITAYPTSFFIDAHGVIQSMHVGSLSGSVLDEKLAKIGIEE